MFKSLLVTTIIALAITGSSVGLAAEGCVVIFTNCQTKQKVTAKMKQGETLYYNDWSGSTCVSKEFTCN